VIPGNSSYTPAIRQAAVEVLDDASPWEQVLQPFLTRTDEFTYEGGKDETFVVLGDGQTSCLEVISPLDRPSQSWTCSQALAYFGFSDRWTSAADDLLNAVTGLEESRFCADLPPKVLSDVQARLQALPNADSRLDPAPANTLRASAPIALRGAGGRGGQEPERIGQELVTPRKAKLPAGDAVTLVEETAEPEQWNEVDGSSIAEWMLDLEGTVAASTSASTLALLRLPESGGAAPKGSESPPPLITPGECQELDRLLALLQRYVHWPQWWCPAVVACWIAHTYMHDAFEIAPRLAILSAHSASGKTRVIDLLDLTVHNGQLMSDTSVPALFRAIDQGAVTPLLDEIDAVWESPDSGRLRSLLNAGYKVGSTIHRAEPGPNKKWKSRGFDIFAPVALAGLGRLPATTLSRCIVIRMKRRPESAALAAFKREAVAEEAKAIRQTIHAWTSPLTLPLPEPDARQWPAAHPQPSAAASRPPRDTQTSIGHRTRHEPEMPPAAGRTPGGTDAIQPSAPVVEGRRRRSPWHCSTS